jgi:S1-C subfamily serine protease
LKVNDIIVSIYDKPVNSAEIFFELKNTYLTGENLVFVVYRHNELTNDYTALNIIITQDKVR